MKKILILFITIISFISYSEEKGTTTVDETKTTTIEKEPKKEPSKMDEAIDRANELTKEVKDYKGTDFNSGGTEAIDNLTEIYNFFDQAGEQAFNHLAMTGDIVSSTLSQLSIFPFAGGLGNVAKNIQDVLKRVLETKNRVDNLKHMKRQLEQLKGFTGESQDKFEKLKAIIEAINEVLSKNYFSYDTYKNWGETLKKLNPNDLATYEKLINISEQNVSDIQGQQNDNNTFQSNYFILLEQLDAINKETADTTGKKLDKLIAQTSAISSLLSQQLKMYMAVNAKELDIKHKEAQEELHNEKIYKDDLQKLEEYTKKLKNENPFKKLGTKFSNVPY